MCVCRCGSFFFFFSSFSFGWGRGGRGVQGNISHTPALFLPEKMLPNNSFPPENHKLSDRRMGEGKKKKKKGFPSRPVDGL